MGGGMYQIEEVERSADYIDYAVRQGGDYSVRIRLLVQNYEKYQTTKDYAVIVKHPDDFFAMIDLIRSIVPKTIFEFGIFQGGSALLWAKLFGARYCGLDALPDKPILHEWVQRLGLSEQVSLNFSSLQNDKAKIDHLFSTHFGGEQIDLIVDDCSHVYDWSRQSFEYSFDHLRPGGVYILEDWHWAHAAGDLWQKERIWSDKKALSNLLFELIMLFGSRPDLIERIDIHPRYAVIRKSATAPRIGPLSLDDLILKQGRIFEPI